MSLCGSHVNSVIIWAAASRFCHILSIPVFLFWSSAWGCCGGMKLDCHRVWPVDTGQKQAAWAEPRPRRCGVGTAEPLGPCREPMGPDRSAPSSRPCVFLYEYLCQCAFVWRCAQGLLFVPRAVCPTRFPFESHTDALSPLPWVGVCFLSVLLSLSVEYSTLCGPSPLFLSVCYLQPSCHISPLPATFLVISEGVTYLCPKRSY